MNHSKIAGVIGILCLLLLTGCTSKKNLANETGLSVEISIQCETVLPHWEELSPGLQEILPKDGILLEKSTAVLQEEDSVFTVLQRVCNDKQLALEFSKTAVYDSVYIEGIGNLYEFDCGQGSGWMYRVNGTFPQMGCSQYDLQDGDVIEWLYTCDLGQDIGGGFPQQGS